MARIEIATATSTATSITPDTPVSSSAEHFVAARRSRAQSVPAEIEDAVLTHIRALRKLGFTSVNTASIASALSLPLPDVDAVINGLRRKGVQLPAR